MRKRNAKILLRFFIAFFLTIIIGLIGLLLYKNAEKESALVTTQIQGTMPEESEADAEMSGDEEKEPTPLREIAEIKEIEEIEEVKEIEEVAGDFGGEIVLAFGGDVCFHDPYANMQTLFQKGGKIETSIDSALLGKMKSADLCMVNNEFPYSDRGEPLPEKTFAFRSRPENVKLLQEMGVDVVSLANNHAYDHGQVAFLDTLSVLEEASIGIVGAGRNLEEAGRAFFLEEKGVKVAILAATQIERLDYPDTKGATETEPGVLRCYSEKELAHFLSLVESVKKQCDVLVVYIHWGTENTDVLDWAQPYQADLISKAGADIIVGAHPHCLQGVDSVNDIPVIYSLGNYWFNSKAMDTALLEVVVNKEGVKSVQIIPARQENCTTSILSDAEKSRVLGYLGSISPNVEIGEDGYVKW